MVTLRTLLAKNQPLGQKLWPTGREQTDGDTHRQRKQTLRTPFFDFFYIFDFLLKGAVRKTTTWCNYHTYKALRLFQLFFSGCSLSGELV